MGLVLVMEAIGGPLFLFWGYSLPLRYIPILRQKSFSSKGYYFLASFLLAILCAVFAVTGTGLAFMAIVPIMTGCLGNGCTAAQYSMRDSLNGFWYPCLIVSLVIYIAVIVVIFVRASKTNAMSVGYGTMLNNPVVASNVPTSTWQEKAAVVKQPKKKLSLAWRICFATFAAYYSWGVIGGILLGPNAILLLPVAIIALGLYIFLVVRKRQKTGSVDISTTSAKPVDVSNGIFSPNSEDNK